VSSSAIEHRGETTRDRIFVVLHSRQHSEGVGDCQPRKAIGGEPPSDGSAAFPRLFCTGIELLELGHHCFGDNSVHIAGGLFGAHAGIEKTQTKPRIVVSYGRHDFFS